MKRGIIVLLHNIRSAHNVGSIFRTADAAGASKIVLAGYTPEPIDRFGRKRSDIAKAALGAEETLLWEYREDAKEAIEALKEEGVVVAAVEQDRRAVDYREYVRSSKDGSICFVFGNEVEGLPEEILSACDVIIEIPMHGTKESLNVSVAAGIVLFSRE